MDLSPVELRRAQNLQYRLRTLRNLERAAVALKLDKCSKKLNAKCSALKRKWYAELQILYDKKFGTGVLASPVELTPREQVIAVLNRASQHPAYVWKHDPEMKKLSDLIQVATGKPIF